MSIPVRRLTPVGASLLLFIVLLPSIAKAQTADAQLQAVAARAKAMGLTLEKIEPGARSAILGQWYLEGLADKSCIGGFFLDMQPDGTAYTDTGREERYTIKSDFIEVSSGTAIFRLSGNYYLPSYECGFAKLIRGPKVTIKTRRKGVVPSRPSDPYSAPRAY